MAGDRDQPDRAAAFHAEAATLLGSIAAVLAVVYAAPLWLGEVFFRRDIARYIHPIYAQVRSRVAAGELPLWTAGEFGGMQLLGDVTNAVLYPPNVALLWLSPARAITVLIVGHHALAALGMALLLRRWGAGLHAALAAGLCFSLSGYAVAMDNSMYYLVGMSWGPLLLWALDRMLERPDARRMAALAASFACVATSGEVQFTYLAAFCCAAYTVAFARPLGRGLRWFLGAGVCALGLAAVQLVPFGSLALTSTRLGGLALEEAQRWALHPLRLFELVLAHPFGMLSEQTFWGQWLVGDDRHSTPWSNGLYVGAVVPLLALLSSPERRTRWLWGLALIATLLAMGPYTPLDATFRAALPLWSAFRYPEKLMSLATLALCLAAGLGVARVLSGPMPRTWPRAFAAGALVAALVVLVITLWPAPWVARIEAALAAGDNHHVAPPEALQMLRASLVRMAAVLAGGGLLLALGRRPSPPAALPWAWAALLVVDVASANGRLIELAPADFYESALPAADAVARHRDEHRPARLHRFELDFRPPPGLPREELGTVHHYWMRQTLVAKTGVERGLRYAAGYSATMDARFGRFWQVANAVPDGRALQLMAVGFLVDSFASPRYRDAPGDRVIAALPELDARVVALGEPAPMARVVYDLRAVSSSRAALEALAAPAFDPRRTAIVEGHPPVPVADGSAPLAHAARFLVDRPEELVIQARAVRRGLLVVAVAHDRRWQAAIDGRPAPLLRVNYMQQGVMLPPGEHRIRIVYRDRGLAVGALISLLTLVLLLVLCARPQALGAATRSRARGRRSPP